MKYIKKYENQKLYDIDNIYSWWTGIKVSEDDDYYYLDLNDIYLSNKRIQLTKGLRDNLVNFYCPELMKYVDVVVFGVMTDSSNIAIVGKFQCDNKQNEKFGVNLGEPIKISKVYAEAKKYNL